MVPYASEAHDCSGGVLPGASLARTTATSDDRPCGADLPTESMWFSRVRTMRPCQRLVKFEQLPQQRFTVSGWRSRGAGGLPATGCISRGGRQYGDRRFCQAMARTCTPHTRYCRYISSCAGRLTRRILKDAENRDGFMLTAKGNLACGQSRELPRCHNAVS